MTVLKQYSEGEAVFYTADVNYYTKPKSQPSAEMPVFYNPRMRLNRDLSVIFLSAYYLAKSKVERICEPLAGSGVRTIRYLKECPGDFKALLFDTNPIAVEIVKKNIALNGLNKRASVVRGDARHLLLKESRSKRFDFVDVDPFGSPAPFLNAAVQSLNKRRGLLALTATDMPALCGIYPLVALRKYGGLSVRAPFSHEIAVRLLIAQTVRIAGMNNRLARPVASLSTDHYIRVWMEIKSDKTAANTQGLEIGFIKFCPSCLNFETLPLQQYEEVSQFSHNGNCKSHPKIAGPLWIGMLYEREYLEWAAQFLTGEQILNKRAEKVITLMREEQSLTKKPYIDIHAICDSYGASPPKLLEIIKRLEESGYHSARTHFKPTAIRTIAPLQDVIKTIFDLGGKK